MTINLQTRIQRLERAAIGVGSVKLEDLVREAGPTDVPNHSPRAAKLCELILATPNSDARALSGAAQPRSTR